MADQLHIFGIILAYILIITPTLGIIYMLCLFEQLLQFEEHAIHRENFADVEASRPLLWLLMFSLLVLIVLALMLLYAINTNQEIYMIPIMIFFLIEFIFNLIRLPLACIRIASRKEPGLVIVHPIFGLITDIAVLYLLFRLYSAIGAMNCKCN